MKDGAPKLKYTGDTLQARRTKRQGHQSRQTILSMFAALAESCKDFCGTAALRLWIYRFAVRLGAALPFKIWQSILNGNSLLQPFLSMKFSLAWNRQSAPPFSAPTSLKAFRFLLDSVTMSAISTSTGTPVISLIAFAHIFDVGLRWRLTCVLSAERLDLTMISLKHQHY